MTRKDLNPDSDLFEQITKDMGLTTSNTAAGTYIRYPPISGGDSPRCDPKYPGTCRPRQPANPYNRGCPKDGRCRDVPPHPPTINI
ncbi:hypothetical protein Bca101_084858 [Brassica carinata]